MDKANVVFDDADSYERYMGRWSRAIGASFLDWIAPPANAAWLDVGCGTGVFTKQVLDTCSPAKIVAIDPASAQIEYALTQPMARSVEFKVAAAYPLPFPARSFDVVASALVMNFVQDRSRALKEISQSLPPRRNSGGLCLGLRLRSKHGLAACSCHETRRGRVSALPRRERFKP